MGTPWFGGSPASSFFPGAFQGQPEKIVLEIGNLQPLVRQVIILTPRASSLHVCNLTKIGSWEWGDRCAKTIALKAVVLLSTIRMGGRTPSGALGWRDFTHNVTQTNPTLAAYRAIFLGDLKMIITQGNRPTPVIGVCTFQKAHACQLCMYLHSCHIVKHSQQ